MGILDSLVGMIFTRLSRDSQYRTRDASRPKVIY
jgi:hypothetical protein